MQVSQFRRRVDRLHHLDRARYLPGDFAVRCVFGNGIPGVLCTHCRVLIDRCHRICRRRRHGVHRRRQFVGSCLGFEVRELRVVEVGGPLVVEAARGPQPLLDLRLNIADSALECRAVLESEREHGAEQELVQLVALTVGSVSQCVLQGS